MLLPLILGNSNFSATGFLSTEIALSDGTLLYKAISVSNRNLSIVISQTFFQSQTHSVFCNGSHIIAAFPGSSVTVGPLLPQNSGWGICGDGSKSGFPISEITLFPIP